MTERFYFGFRLRLDEISLQKRGHRERNVSMVLLHSIEPVHQRDMGDSNSDTHTLTHTHGGVVVPVKQANYNDYIMSLMNTWKDRL